MQMKVWEITYTFLCKRTCISWSYNTMKGAKVAICKSFVPEKIILGDNLYYSVLKIQPLHYNVFDYVNRENFDVQNNSRLHGTAKNKHGENLSTT